MKAFLIGSVNFYKEILSTLLTVNCIKAASVAT